MADKDLFTDEGNALKVQRDQLTHVVKNGAALSAGIDRLSNEVQQTHDELVDLLAEAERLCAERGLDVNADSESDVSEVEALLAEIKVDESEVGKIDQVVDVKPISEVSVGDDWESYLSGVNAYADANNIDLSGDPFETLLTPAERQEIAQRIEDDYKLHGEANCDKWDYILAGACGLIGGFVDSLFVGMPGASKLGNVSDKAADVAVEKFAKFVNFCDKKHVEKLIKDGKIVKWSDYMPTGRSLQKNVRDRDVASAIGYLEKRFNAPYDARYANDLVGAGASFSPADHHLKSGGHCADVFGLFISILDQFTGHVTILSNGKMGRYAPAEAGDFRLQGTNLCTKIIFGFINWFGHIMSDFAGSSGTRGHKGTRGSGIAAPFFELFQFCDFGSFDVNGDKKTLAELTTSMYTHGYDARFAAATAVPVALTEMLVRLCWSVKRHYYHKLPWSECVPFKVSERPELRRMLLVGHGSLCLVDAADAAARSWGNMLNFMLHLNITAWARFAQLGLLEIRAKFNKNALNTAAMEEDLKAGWDVLLKQSESFSF